MKKNLESLRNQVGDADREIVRLLNERARLAIEIGKIKDAEGRDVFDPAQESKVREGIIGLNRGPLTDEALSAIYREIVSVSRSLQAPLGVAYFGPEASFTHMAALSHFGEGVSYVPHATITDIFDEVEKGKISVGIIPLENSLEGSVKQTLDRLVSTPLQIRAEIFLRIRQFLLSAQEDLTGIKRVYSHPQGLAQCRIWLRRNLPLVELIETQSTAGAAKRVIEDPESAAIGSSRAASVYGLKVVAEGIEDNPSNTTRFIVIGKGKNRRTGNDKTSILFSTPHAPGALYRALGTLAAEGINMTRIESYPAKTGPWDYLFFVDFEGHREEAKAAHCLRELKQYTTFTKVLGSYPRGDAL
jgi:chorismate mutase / prephenate dehydratase